MGPQTLSLCSEPLKQHLLMSHDLTAKSTIAQVRFGVTAPSNHQMHLAIFENADSDSDSKWLDFQGDFGDLRIWEPLV